jgi:CBS-domain-containing membrane protein
LLKTQDRSITVRDVMGRELITAGADEDLSHVLKRMQNHAVRRMPVINSLEALVGIVTYDDLIRELSEELADFTRLFSRQIARERARRT